MYTISNIFVFEDRYMQYRSIEKLPLSFQSIHSQFALERCIIIFRRVPLKFHRVRYRVDIFYNYYFVIYTPFTLDLRNSRIRRVNDLSI